MSYRDRIYARYASTVQGRTQPPTLAELDRWAASYDTYLRDWLPADPHAAIVDLACGSGGLLRFFTRRGYTNVTGVDISPQQVEFARAVHPNVLQANVLDFLRTAPARFDLITAIDLFEHLTRDEALDFLDACRSALRPGGRLVLQTPNMDSPAALAIRYGDNTHEIGYNPASLSQLLALCGFKGIQARETGPVPHGFLSAARWALWRLFRLSIALFNTVETGSPGSRVYTRVFLITGTI